MLEKFYLSRHVTLRLKTQLSYVILFFTSILLLTAYREGGPKDVGISNFPHLRDAGVYLEVGRYILAGENPYIPPMSRWGTFGPIPFTLFFDLFPDSILTIIFQTVNLIGIYFFLRLLLRNRNLPIWRINLGAALIFVCSPVREMLSTNQIIGITVGFFSLGIWSFLESKRQISRILPRRAWLLISGFAFAVSIDLKPHLFLVIFVCVVFMWKTWKLPVTVTCILILSHTLVNLSQMRILEKDWLDTLLNLRESAGENSLGDTLAIWPLVAHWFQNINYSAQAGLLFPLILSVGAILNVRRNKNQVGIFLGLLAPSVSFYSHYYDLIPVLIFAVSIFMNSRDDFMPMFAISFCILPLRLDSFQNLVLLFTGAIFCSILLQIRKKRIVWAVLGVVAGVLFRWLIFSPNYSDYLIQSTIVTGTILVLSLGLLSNNSNKGFQEAILK